MDIKIISDYFYNNSDFIIRNRASVYLPKYIGFVRKAYVFECAGSKRKNYVIRIKLSEDKVEKTTCTCPYDGLGICKHQVASLDALIKLVKFKKINFEDDLYPDNANVNKNKTLILPHNNRAIDKNELKKIRFSHNTSFYGEIRIKKIEALRINGVFENFANTFKLSYYYHKQTDQVRVDCSCKKEVNCNHKFQFLSHINNEIDLDFFVENFTERLKESHMLELDLLGKVSFDELFTLIINEKDGIVFEEKLPNVVSDPLRIFNPKEIINLKPGHDFQAPKSTPQYSLGLSIEIENFKIGELVPFYGKLNKNKTEISTGLKKINENNLTKTLGHLSSTDSGALSDLLKLSDSHKTLNDLEYRAPSEVELINQYYVAIYQQFQSSLKTFLNSAVHKLFIHFYELSFSRKNLIPLQVITQKVTPKLQIQSKDKFFELQFKCEVGGQSFLLSDDEVLISPLGILVNQKTLYVNITIQQLLGLKALVQYGQLHMLDEGAESLRKKVIDNFSPIFEIEYEGLAESEPVEEENTSFQVYLSDADEGEYLVFEPIMKYDEHLVKPNSFEKIWVNETALVSLKRNKEDEEKLVTLLQNLHPSFETNTESFYISAQDAMEDLWIMNAIESLKENNVEVYGLNSLKNLKYNLNKPSFSIGLTSGIDWFDMEIDISFGDQKVNLQELQKAIIKKSNYVQLGDGSIGILPQDWIDKYRKYFKIGQVKKNKIEMSNFQFSVIDELYNELETSPDFLNELYEKKKAVANLKKLTNVVPSKHLKATLRPYQQEGLNWMVFLYNNKLGGCLADDMGLGKTLQTIAFLQHLKDAEKPEEKKLPTLVVAPTSLVFNWLAELDKFAPKLTKIAFIGANREELLPKFESSDIILTTYGSVLRDIDLHKSKRYNYVVLDESQAIKNPQSQRYKALRLLKANNRLALTGTPIENNTFDLYSQFNFLNPGMFGSVKHFRTQFSEAIDKAQDQETSALLSKMIHPFILRRTKAQVATELPDKTESIIYCNMGAQQQKVYDQFKNYFREKLAEQIEAEGINKSQMYILQGLTKLRQICNSTALASKTEDYGNYSVKLDELTRHLKEKVNKHKILVFSQFVGMLELVKDRLDEEQIVYEYLDGQTKNREEKVTNFQENEEVRVFLISLKAGGTGLNLTKAEYVYLIDPWWNPAVENQAIDRCYRIGQKNKVMAYRMICKNTIEEKIVSLQDKKKAVASDIIRTDVEQKKFNKKDIEVLFS